MHMYTSIKERQLISRVLNVTHTGHPPGLSLALHEAYNNVNRYLDYAKQDATITQVSAELHLMVILLAKHLTTLWYGTFVIARKTWEGRFEASASGYVSEALDIVFTTNGYENASRDEIAVYETLRICTTRNGLLTTACMCVMPALTAVFAPMLSATDQLTFTRMTGMLLDEWAEMFSLLDVEEYIENENTPDKEGPYYVHNGEDWTVAACMAYELFYEYEDAGHEP